MVQRYKNSQPTIFLVLQPKRFDAAENENLSRKLLNAVN
jgi:hypothetical protein